MISNFFYYTRFFALFLFLFFSCRNLKDDHTIGGKPFIVNLDSSAKLNSIAYYTDKMSLVKLESNDSSNFSAAGSIQKIIHKDGKFFLLDGSYMAIKVFDSSGKFLFNIGKLGIGKGEFIRVDDIEYYAPANSIMVLCNNPSKLSEFRLNGQWIKDTRLNFWATKVVFPTPDSRIFYVNSNKSALSGNKNILITDSLNQIKTRMFEMAKNISAVIKFSGNLFFVDSNIIFNPAFSNTYYKITSDMATTLFVTDYGKKNIPPNIPQNYLMPNLSKFSYQYQTLSKNNEFVGFNYKKNQLETAFFNLHSGKVISSESNIDSLNALYRNFMFQDGENYIMVLSLDQLSGFLKRNSNRIKEKFPLLYSQLGEDNPRGIGLLIFKLKPF